MWSLKKGNVNNKMNKNAQDGSARFLKRVINGDQAYVTPCLKGPGLHFDIKKAASNIFNSDLYVWQ